MFSRRQLYQMWGYILTLPASAGGGGWGKEEGGQRGISGEWEQDHSEGPCSGWGRGMPGGCCLWTRLRTAPSAFRAQTLALGRERLLYMVHESKRPGGGKVKPLSNECCDRDE